ASFAASVRVRRRSRRTAEMNLRRAHARRAPPRMPSTHQIESASMDPPSELSHTMSNAGAWASEYHAPVMAKEVVDVFRGCGVVLDGTLGGGGHALALLESGVRVIGIDRDLDAVAAARERLAAYETADRFRAIVANFAALDDVVDLNDTRFDG